MNTRQATSGLLLALLAACATPVASGPPRHGKAPALQQLQQRQRLFRQQNTVPQVFDFEGHGRVTVREVSLDGFPGNTYLRAKFNYQNRTDEPIVQSWVMLDVFDAKDRMVASQAVVCIIPHPMPIARGSYVADELRTRTYGVHLEDGWSWRIRCVAQRPQHDPLDPPVPERTWPSLPPIIIKNRGQNDFLGGSSSYDRDGTGNRVVGGRGVNRPR